MKFLIILTIFALAFAKSVRKGRGAGTSTKNEPDWYDPVINMTVPQMIQNEGYPAGEYKVITEDGYILGVHRILAPRFQQPNMGKRGPPVLLQHGLEACSANWVEQLWNESLGFILADAGYDVWLGNMRGNTYSKAHVSLDPTKDDFWQFSFDEMAKFDLPAMVNFILKETGYDQIYYIGHSQGTMIGFAQFSQDPVFAQKIKAFFALGPVAKVHNIQAPLRLLAAFTTELDDFFKIVGLQDFLPNNGIVQQIEKIACEGIENPTEKLLCGNLLFLLSGPFSQQLNETRIPVLISHCPAGTSTLNVAHFGQLVNSDRFCKFDYGTVKNLQKYGQIFPPEYPLENLKVKTALFWGAKDELADPKDVEFIRKKIQNNLIGDFEYEDYTHIDFIWGMSAPNRVYNLIMDLMKQY